MDGRFGLKDYVMENFDLKNKPRGRHVVFHVVRSSILTQVTDAESKKILETDPCETYR